ncbi:T cell activation RhoGTPase activating protein b [Trichomycterus rosablanca]|uniref:T cell activation RhoGTPase activating protein b n=1 Tax=Trichomycterus rosablanca TaxID=2290929 RepID=UPI002F351063
MKVLSTSSTTTKSAGGGGMEESVIELQVNGHQGNGSVPAPQCKPEQPIDPAVGKKSVFTFKLKRSCTHTGLPTRPKLRTRLLFGQPLPPDAIIPKPIADLLMLLWRKASGTEGVFRTACNSKNLNAVRDQLDSGAEVDMEALPVTLLVGLLKTFLRELPGSLLVSELFEEWIEALKATETLTELRRMVSKLPEANGVLLQRLLCLLHHIIQHSDKNRMDPYNMAICIGPTLLQPAGPALDVSSVEKVNRLTQFLIENCIQIFGKQILKLLVDPEEEELADNSDAASMQHHDSAYDSTDPDGDGESGEATGRSPEDDPHPGIQRSCNHSHSSESLFEHFAKPFDRRCSEPTIFPSADVTSHRFLARSHDDCFSPRDFADQPLKKQNSDDSFLHQQNRRCQPSLRKTTGSLNLDVPFISKTSCSSSCSLESANSSVSENSVFAGSPLPSPSSPRKEQPERNASLSVRSKTETEPRRSFGFKRARSLGSFSINRGSSKKSEAQKDAGFPCETLQEDSQNETESADEPARRQRPLSAIEVFEHVDSREPGRPPSYEQSVTTGVLHNPAQYRRMTVRDARKARPVSMNDNILDAYPVIQFPDQLKYPSCDAVAPQPGSFRQRAMSESVGCTRVEKLTRRCSQPVFEEFAQAKESCV